MAAPNVVCVRNVAMPPWLSRGRNPLSLPAVFPIQAPSQVVVVTWMGSLTVGALVIAVVVAHLVGLVPTGLAAAARWSTRLIVYPVSHLVRPL